MCVYFLFVHLCVSFNNYTVGRHAEDIAEIEEEIAQHNWFKDVIAGGTQEEEKGAHH